MHRRLTFFSLVGLMLPGFTALGDRPVDPGPPGQINVLVTWTDNTDDEVGFVIQRATSSRGPWVMAGSVAPDTTTFLDRDLKGSTTYYYRTYAVGTNGFSPFSPLAVGTTPRRATIPWMHRQPMSQAVPLGSNAVFSAEPWGTPPLNFQWRFNGTNLDGETRTNLELHSVRLNQAGDYSQVVSNANGWVVSRPARLTITSPLTIQINGGGRVLPNYNQVYLEVGRRYTIRAYPAAGSVFQRWSGGTNVSTSPVLSFVMETNFVLQANFLDVARPTIIATSPRRGARQTNSVAMIQGMARDNREIAFVNYQVNNGEWTKADGTTNWQGQINLSAGNNTWHVYAVDATGNCSLTNSQIVTCVVTYPLIVQTNGSGIVSPNYNNRSLEIGATYAMTARAAGGFMFTNWTVTDSFTATNFSRPSIPFQMRSNLVLQANFIDVQRPTITISNSIWPKRILTNSAVIVRGAASDNSSVETVFYQLNDSPWAEAIGTTNWTAPVELATGTNVFRAYSMDASGNRSLTNKLTSVVIVEQPSVPNLVNDGGNAAAPLPASNQAPIAPPAINNISVLGNTVTISVMAVTNAKYTLEFTDTNPFTEWTPVANSVLVTAGLLQLSDTNAPPTSRFYRVRATAH
jgi:hypothetical protein